MKSGEGERRAGGGAGKGDGSGRDVFLRRSPSVSVSQLLCVWVSLHLSLPYRHLSELPSEPLQTPEFRAPTRTVTKGFEPRRASESWGSL